MHSSSAVLTIMMLCRGVQHHERFQTGRSQGGANCLMQVLHVLYCRGIRPASATPLASCRDCMWRVRSPPAQYLTEIGSHRGSDPPSRMGSRLERKFGLLGRCTSAVAMVPVSFRGPNDAVCGHGNICPMPMEPFLSSPPVARRQGGK